MGFGGCSKNRAASPSLPSPAAARGATATQDLVFSGMCDASGAVALSPELFAIADDEDNAIRVYDANRGGAPLSTSDVSPALPLQALAGKKKAKHLEMDIEAATRIGDLALWITSHGRNSSGKERPERLLMFATTAPRAGTAIAVVGVPYLSLLDDLSSDARYAAFDLVRAAERAPKEPGGLNIEGMTARPDGGLFIGFRSPVPGGRALLARILNPLAVIEGKPAAIGDPVLVDLGGLGIRSLSWWRGGYLIVGGPVDKEAPFHLFRWDGEGSATSLDGVDLGSLNPEALFAPAELERVLLLSDDGSEPVDGVPCKNVKDVSRKRFRGRWVAIPGQVPPPPPARP